MTFKDLIKTTEGAIVLGGLLLTVFSPIFGPKVWAVITGTAYVAINMPQLVSNIKNWFNSLNSGDTD